MSVMSVCKIRTDVINSHKDTCYKRTSRLVVAINLYPRALTSVTAPVLAASLLPHIEPSNHTRTTDYVRIQSTFCYFTH